MDTPKLSYVNDSGIEAASAGAFATRAPADAAHCPPSGNTGESFTQRSIRIQVKVLLSVLMAMENQLSISFHNQSMA
jgi:hypothetical protein